jgi:peptidoglycan/LPS O-acetylase OafA/YrhL
MRVSSVTAELHPTYRPDIDGLRAVAILSVLGFHTFPHVVRGGFVGVDVFFVISGYLISSIILGGLRQNRFSLSQFYARRIRRIFPALIVVLVACFAVGWLALLADEFTQLGKHIAASSGFSMNLVLWGESGYFDTAAGLKPLLHIWSLGVEEQFYILWPLLLYLAWKGRVNLFALTLSIIAISFWLSVRTTHTSAVAAFYSPATRFWELLIGCSLALTGSSRAGRVKATVAENVRAGVGCLLISAAVLGLSKGVEFPGWWALLPTVGTFLFISAGPHAWLNRNILSHRIMVGIGLISYPLYLWHWPLLSFARIRQSTAPSLTVRITLVLLSVLLAWLTFKFIENPARHSRGARTVGLLIVLMIAIGSLGVYTFDKNGFDTRFPESIRAYANYRYNPGVNARPYRCWLTTTQSYTEYSDECVDPSKSAAKPLIFIWGDSHAARLYAGMNQVYGERYRLAQFTRDACPPLLGIGDELCSQGNLFILRKIEQERPAIVILFDDWSGYSKDWGREPDTTRALFRTLSALTEIGIPTVIVVGPAPKWEKALPKLVYEAAVRDAPRYRVPPRMSFGLDQSFAGVDSSLRELLIGHRVRYFSIRDVMCNEQGCLTHVGEGPDEIVSWDMGHLTTAGAAYVAERILP